MKILSYVLCMFVASANSGHTFDGSTFEEGIDVDGDFGRHGWHGVSQVVTDGEIKSFSEDNKSTVHFDDYGEVFGSGKPISEVMEEEGAFSQGDYGKYAEFKEDVASPAGGGSAAISSTGWYGISGENSAFKEYNQVGKVVHEDVGTEGLGSFRTIQPHIAHNEYVHHESLSDFSEQHKIKSIKANREEDGSDAFGTYGDLSEFTAGQSYFDSYGAGGGYKSHFGFDQFGGDHSEQEVKSFLDENHNEGADIFKTHIAHEATTNLNQFGGLEEFPAQHEYKTSTDVHADDFSHGYHEYGGFNSAQNAYK